MIKYVITAVLLMGCIPLYAMPFGWVLDENAPTEPVVMIDSNHSTPGHLSALSSKGRVYVSQDWGEHWLSTQIPAGYSITLLKKDPSRASIWLAAGHDNSGKHCFLMSSDDALSFQSVSEIPAVFDRLSASPLIPGLILAAVSGQSQLFRSIDDGKTWTLIPGTFSTSSDPVWHPTANWIAYYGSSRSTDYGVSFTQVSVHEVMNASLQIPPVLFSAINTGVYASRDDLKSWWPLILNPSNFVTTNPRTPQQIFAGSTDGNGSGSAYIFYSDDAGITFNSWSDGLPRTFESVEIAASWLVFVISEGKVYKYDERRADLDSNLRIDGGDLVILSLAFGSSKGDASYNPIADLNSDNAVDGQDLIILSAVWGHRFYYEDKQPPGDF